MEAMQQSISEALSNSEVAERIWAVESNRFCADCGSPKPDWASINLCVVICKRCAGTHPYPDGHRGGSLGTPRLFPPQNGSLMAHLTDRGTPGIGPWHHQSPEPEDGQEGVD